MRHHYVPQFLLKYWAKHTPDKKVETFRLDQSKISSKRYTPKYVGFEHDLYTLKPSRTGSYDAQAIETKVLKQIDSSAARVLHKMFTSGPPSLTGQDHIDWTAFLMSLRSRNPDFIEHFNSVVPNALKESLDANPKEYDALSEVSDPPTLSKYAEQNFPDITEEFKLSLFKNLATDSKIGNKILNMNWGLCPLKVKKSHLLLSDSPIIFTEGIDHPDLIIALPVGPHTAFMATNTDRIVAAIQRSPQEHLMTRINESSLNQARKRIYALDRSLYSFISDKINRRKSHRPT